LARHRTSLRRREAKKALAELFFDLIHVFAVTTHRTCEEAI
jgi:low temperature requirement protein LtrA